MSGEIEKYDFVIFGISKDTVKTHANFSKKLGIKYTLLSDVEREVMRQFGVVIPKKMYGKDVLGTQRSTFIIDKEGELNKKFEAVKASGHASEVLKYIKENFKVQ